MSAALAQYLDQGAGASGIRDAVELAVERGELAPGQALPSVRELARDVGVSPATVAAAFRQLRQRGIVVTRPRSGTRVSRRPPLVTRPEAALPDGTIDLASGNPDPALLPDLGPFLAGVSGEPVLYGAQGVDPSLRERADVMFRAEGVSTPGVAVTSGALDGLERVLGAWLRPGDRVLVEDPGYTGTLDLVRAMGLVPVGVDVDERGPLPDALAAGLLQGPRAVVVTPRAHNPTGAALSPARAADLAPLIAAHPGVLLVEDDHAGPVAGVELCTLTRSAQRWALVRSLSKSLGPDLRMALVAGDEATLGRLEGRQRLGPGWVSHVLQRTAAALLGDANVTAQLERARAVYTDRRGGLRDALAERGIAARARSGLNVWVPVAEEEPVVRGLLGSGWAVRGGEPYRLASPPAVRVTISTLRPETANRLAIDLAALLRPRRRRTNPT